MTNNDDIGSSCLLGAMLFLGLYLLFTCWCTKKDNYISPTTQQLAMEMESSYVPADELQRRQDQDYSGTDVESEAIEDTLDYYHSFDGEPMRIGKSLAFQAASDSKHTKNLRYC